MKTKSRIIVFILIVCISVTITIPGAATANAAQGSFDAAGFSKWVEALKDSIKQQVENDSSRNDSQKDSQKNTGRKLIIVDSSMQANSENPDENEPRDAVNTANDTEEELGRYSGVVLDEGIMDIPYFSQNKGYYYKGQWLNQEWANVVFDAYPDKSIPTSGCGYCCIAMAFTYLLDRFVAPTEMMNNGTYNYNSGMSYNGGVVAGKDYGVPAKTTNDPDEAYAALLEGHPIMVIEGGLPWATSGHYILVTGVTPDGKVAVNDCAEEARSYPYNKTLWEWSDVETPAKYASGMAFTIFG